MFYADMIWSIEVVVSSLPVDESPRVFRASVRRTVFWGGGLLILVFTLILGKEWLEGHLSGEVVVVASVMTAIGMVLWWPFAVFLTWRFSVELFRGGLAGYDYFGRRVFVAWEDMIGYQLLDSPTIPVPFLPALRVFSASGAPVPLPMNIRDFECFVAEVKVRAGEDHPVLRILEELKR